MNRKERRAAKRSGAASMARPLADGTRNNQAGTLFRNAVAHHQAGAFDKAERAYRQILTLIPAHAEAHSRLGAVMIAQGNISEAVLHMEQAVELRPDLFEAHANLAQAYTWSGQHDRATDASCRALELFDSPQTRTLFAQCVAHARFTSDSGKFRKHLQRALKESWLRPRELTPACISLIKLDRTVSDGISRVNSAWPARLNADQLLGRTEIGALAQDQLLCALLECDPVTDVGLERLLTSIRHCMLASLGADTGSKEGPLNFLCSLARQCFINEYVFSITPDEARLARQLCTTLEQTFAKGESCSPLRLAIVSAYFPLHSLTNAESLLDRPWPQAVMDLLVQQIQEPAQERSLATTIPAITGIDSEVSRAVRKQYEQNPYPRWVKALAPGQPAPPRRPASGRPFDALIAGCGTGLSTIEFALQVSNARILAIDLSLASLSYAKRMAQKFQLTNVEFGQADIMKLASIGRQFDFIDASGVLHHLADPWAGWRILLSLLRPGSSMQVGLYSKLARRHIAASRALIAQRNDQPTAEDIRQCREQIIASQDPLFRLISEGSDFYTISECRDLFFHVQEHGITLPEIKNFLGANGLQFAEFYVDPKIRDAFSKRFPGPTALNDLDCWHAFETDFPNTFAAMYQFSVRKFDGLPSG
ncbi:MAG TPA: methyltransferase domain-containing protein [Verrucomicrobiae bacterium]|nr:methyltransferase domain-containing protein [Verrucomicrobiae bacterium]